MVILTAKIIIRRFFEILFYEVLISAIIAGLSAINVFTALGTLVTVLFFGVLLFMGIHFVLLRNCCYDLPDNSLYFLINIIAYALFAMTCIGTYVFCSSEVYTWLFAVMKFMRYINEAFNNFSSAVIFLIIGFLVVFIAPCGVERLILPDAESDEDDGSVIIV